MITFTFNYKPSKFMQNPTKLILKVVRDSKFIAEEKYKREMPVNTGLARNSVAAKDTAKGFTVSSQAKTSGGFMYPLAVAQGTGKYKGAAIDVAQSARQRMGRKYSKKEIIMFKSMRKRGVILSIKPNKFPKRALEQSEKPVTQYIITNLNRLINE